MSERVADYADYRLCVFTRVETRCTPPGLLREKYFFIFYFLFSLGYTITKSIFNFKRRDYNQFSISKDES